MPFLFQSCIDFNNFQAWRYLCFLVTFSWTNYTPVRKLWVFLTTFCVLSFQLCSKTSVFLVSIGVVLTTLSRPSSPSKRSTEDLEQYIIGIFMLTISSLLTGVLGMLQELTYRKYGPCWREGVFYTVSFILYFKIVSDHCHGIQHFLSLPIFLFLVPDIKQGLGSLSTPSSTFSGPYIILAGNLITQLICVSGVNRLSSVCIWDDMLILMLMLSVLIDLASIISVNQPCAHHTQSH